MARPATADDVDAICRGLPEVELGTSWGDRPTYLVRGHGFLLFRAPHASAAVLVQQSRLGEAWAARAPERLVKEHLGDG